MEHLLDWLVGWARPIFWWNIAVLILILYPFFAVSFFIRKFRTLSTALILYSSFVSGACLWITSIAVTYWLWGLLPVIIGLLVLGVGIVPICLLAELISGSWQLLGITAFLIACTAIPRLVAVWAIHKFDRPAVP